MGPRARWAPYPRVGCHGVASSSAKMISAPWSWRAFFDAGFGRRGFRRACRCHAGRRPIRRSGAGLGIAGRPPGRRGGGMPPRRVLRRDAASRTPPTVRRRRRRRVVAYRRGRGPAAGRHLAGQAVRRSSRTPALNPAADAFAAAPHVAAVEDGSAGPAAAAAGNDQGRAPRAGGLGGTSGTGHFVVSWSSLSPSVPAGSGRFPPESGTGSRFPVPLKRGTGEPVPEPPDSVPDAGTASR